MIVYRLSKADYASDLSGKGAELYGGRWNSAGKPMVYCCENRALCLLEITVHSAMNNLPIDYKLVTTSIPDHSMKQIHVDELQIGWNEFPHRQETIEMGNRFLSNKTDLGLKVPSAIVQGEYNVLLNPTHKLMRKVKIVSKADFRFDKRLFQ